MAFWDMSSDLIFGALLLRYLLNFFEKEASFQYVIITMLFLLLFQIGYSFYSNYYKSIFIPISDNKIFEMIQKRIFIQSKEVELKKYDDPEYYNAFMRAVNESGERANKCLDSFLKLLCSIISLGVLFIVVADIGVSIIIISVIPVIINLYFGKKLAKKSYDADLEMVPHKKAGEYVKRVFFLKEYCYEIKLSNISKVLFRTFNDSVRNMVDIHKKYGASILLIKMILITISDVVCYFSSILYACYKFVVLNAISLGDFTFIVTSLNRLAAAITQVIDSSLELQKGSQFIKNVRQFLIADIPNENARIIENDEIKEINYDENHIIEFEDVSFRYNENSDYILKNLNFKINPGEKIAFVGNNGAGKSTLINLLLRLYEPVSGKILLDGINIQDYNIKAYRKLFGCIFQDFSVFSISIAENVLCREALPEDRSKVIRALIASGLYEDIDRMGYHLNSIVTKEFDNKGINFSGGQSQKLATARAFIFNNTIGILDEPSSALDPISEHNLFQNIQKIYEKRTAIFISHRLSSTLHADKIFFLENGRITEEGSHSQLIGENGKYAYMFNLQAQNYKEKGESQDE